MELTTSQVAADHDLFDGQTLVTIQIFNPATETWGAASAPVSALRRTVDGGYVDGGSDAKMPIDRSTFTIKKSNWPNSTPNENDKIIDANGDVWRVDYGSPDEKTLRSRWVIKTIRAN